MIEANEKSLKCSSLNLQIKLRLSKHFKNSFLIYVCTQAPNDIFIRHTWFNTYETNIKPYFERAQFIAACIDVLMQDCSISVSTGDTAVLY